MSLAACGDLFAFPFNCCEKADKGRLIDERVKTVSIFNETKRVVL